MEQSTVHVLQNSAIAAVIKVVSSVILLKILGFTGGALGSVVAFASYFIITCVRVRSRFLFRVAPINLVRIIVSALLCGAAAFACTCCRSAISFALARLSWSVQVFMPCALSSAVRAARKYRRCSAG